MKDFYENTSGGDRSCHAAPAGRHLENHCDEVGRNSIKERSLENCNTN